MKEQIAAQSDRQLVQALVVANGQMKDEPPATRSRVALYLVCNLLADEVVSRFNLTEAMDEWSMCDSDVSYLDWLLMAVPAEVVS